MAQQHGLIEPFEAGQVRESERGRVISYGTSSYGYDVRCAREFKIFTNINSTIVDPKQFDEKSFVDISADVCIIPPNSFALARTVEYFRIPRNVLTVCLGKCVTGDTRVVDADSGAYVPITEMRWGRTTLALDHGRLRRAKVAAFMPQGKRAVFELRTRAGLRIRATASHPFLKLDRWAPLSELKPGDRIAVARYIPVFGKTPIPDWQATLLGLMISAQQRDPPGRGPACAAADPTLLGLRQRCVAASGGRLQGGRLRLGAGDRGIPRAIFEAPEHAVRLFLQALFSGGGVVCGSAGGVWLESRSGSRRLAEDLHHLLLRFGIFASIREQRAAGGCMACWIQITDEDQIRRFADRVGCVPGSMMQQRLQTQVLPLIRAQSRRRSSLDVLSEEDRTIVAAAGRVGGVTSMALDRRARPDRSAARAADWYATAPIDGPVWDAVERVEPAGEDEVFDISVPAVHNFVANDLIAHNSTYARCGIIVNVTPLEPEWEGHVTLEFSNTTPLPAKIYANEGVAQMLFFESDEVCSTSYADRGGKYQGQKGVTLPKA